MQKWLASVGLALSALVATAGLGLSCYILGRLTEVMSGSPFRMMAHSPHSLWPLLALFALLALWVGTAALFGRWVWTDREKWPLIGLPAAAFAYAAIETFRYQYACNPF